MKTIETGRGETFRARAVILTMGSAYRKLGLPEEAHLSGHGLSWCATCDELRASKIMVERVLADPKIEIAWNSNVDQILGTEQVTGLRLRDTVTGAERAMAAAGTGCAAAQDAQHYLSNLAPDKETAAPSLVNFA